MFYKAITNRQVLRFSYQPFGQELFSLTFHPQFLKEYNGRWFVLGEANREPYHAYSVPFGRIVGDVKPVESIEYIPAAGTISDNRFGLSCAVAHCRPLSQMGHAAAA